MATIEKGTLLSTKNEEGDLVLLYPVTTSDRVAGLPENYAPKEHTHSTVNGFAVEADVPADAKFTDTVLTETDVTSWGFTKDNATATSDGLMSSDDKNKLDEISYKFGSDEKGYFMEQIEEV